MVQRGSASRCRISQPPTGGKALGFGAAHHLLGFPWAQRPGRFITVSPCSRATILCNTEAGHLAPLGCPGRTSATSELPETLKWHGRETKQPLLVESDLFSAATNKLSSPPEHARGTQVWVGEDTLPSPPLPTPVLDSVPGKMRTGRWRKSVSGIQFGVL